MPAGVHLAVVDPGVGGDRRAIAVRGGDGRLFVGPDNGLLILAAEQLAGSTARTSSTNERLPADRVSARSTPATSSRRRPRTSPPASPIAELGPSLEPSTLVRLDAARAAGRHGRDLGDGARRSIASGTSRLNAAARAPRRARRADGDRVEIRLTLDRYYAVVAGTFADAPPGELIVYEDSYGLVTLAISRGDAARLTGVGLGDELRIAVG